jgi:hypothetical protein
MEETGYIKCCRSLEKAEKCVVFEEVEFYKQGGIAATIAQ